MSTGIFFHEPAQAQDINNPSGSATDKSLGLRDPNLEARQGSVDHNGAFSQHVPIEIPKFRTLEPKLALTYRSSQPLNRGITGVLPVGWNLSGISSIQRANENSGRSRHESWDGDMLVLDGTELLACQEVSDPNPFPTGQTDHGYSDSWYTQASSASCLAGGNLTAKRENNLKILANFAPRSGDGDATQRIEEIRVFKPNGTQLLYQTIGALKGLSYDDPTLSEQERVFAFEGSWLLSQVFDAQRDANNQPVNVVTYHYDIGDFTSGFDIRPESIEYAGYRVVFHFEDSLTATSDIAMGVDFFGKQDKQLAAIEIQDGSQQIAAYELNYSLDASDQEVILTEIKQFGEDYTISVSDGIIDVSGSSLPSWRFEYDQKASLDFVAETFPSTNVHRFVSILDANKDGIDELHFSAFDYFDWKRKRPSWSCKDEYLTEWAVPSSGYQLISGSLTNIGTQAPDLYFDSHYGPDDCTKEPERSIRKLLHGSTTRDGSAIPEVIRTYRFNADGMNIETKIYYTHTDPISGETGSDISPSNADFDDYFVYCDANDNLQNRGVVYLQTDKDTEVESLSLYDLLETPNSVCFGSPADLTPRILDIDGDGISEFLMGGYLYRQNLAGKYVGSEIDPNIWSEIEGDETRFGDVNGDGASDAVKLTYNTADPNATELTITVWLSNGVELTPSREWGRFSSAVGSSAPYLGAGSASFATVFDPTWTDGYFVPEFIDLDGDGLTDLLLKTVSPAMAVRLVDAPKGADAVLLRNTPTGFETISSVGDPVITNYIGAGDFDGDGDTDLAYIDSNEGTGPLGIYWNNHEATLLTAVQDQVGAVTEISYTSSSGVSDNEIPYTQQLVETILVRDGLEVPITGELDAATREQFQTRFEYDEGRYDAEMRKSLGFGIVRSFLPKLDTETEHPVRTRFYYTGHFAYAGQLSSENLSYDGIVQRETTYAHEIRYDQVAQDYPLPYQSRKIREIESTRFGDQLVATEQEFTYTDFGALETVISKGNKLTSGDETFTSLTYVPNLSAFIVNKPEEKLVVKGDAATTDTTMWLTYEKFEYDGYAAGVAPASGNVTSSYVWTGSPAIDWRRTALKTYDDYGNVIAVQNARSYVSYFEFDLDKNLFQTAAENAKGHIVSTEWDAHCQKPTSQTDQNGAVTTLTYDVFCREIARTLPTGHTTTTSYVSLGDPLNQHVQVESPSYSTLTGAETTFSRSYFDGKGRSYKAVDAGRTSALEDASVVLTRFDARGNARYTSVPSSWADTVANTITDPTQRTDMSYDAQNRLVAAYIEGQQLKSVTFDTKDLSQFGETLVQFPSVATFDAHCFDNDPDTICGRVERVSDVRGNVIRQSLYDVNGTDVDAADFGTTERATQYRYDLLNRLVEVEDPAGATWFYEYDAFGDRIFASDPALGDWSMSYDEHHNLTLQTDAKGQTMAFEYDALDRPTLKTVTDTSGSETIVQTGYDWNRTGYDFNIGRMTSLNTPVRNGVAVPNPDEYFAYNYDEVGNLVRAGLKLDGRWFAFDTTYHPNGLPKSQSLPQTPGAQSTDWLDEIEYDAAGRPVSMGALVTNTTYNLASKVTETIYGSGVRDVRYYNPSRGWLNGIALYKPVARIDTDNPIGNEKYENFSYARSATGRIINQNTWDARGDLDFHYDYAGRLLHSESVSTQPYALEYDQIFTYDAAGNMRSNSKIGDYLFDPANLPHAPISAGGQTFTYDANGNMLTGFDGKVMTYDAENRPLSVTKDGKTTEYVYGPDGTRLRKIERVGEAVETITVYLGGAEFRNWGQGSLEEVITYPRADVRLTNGEVAYLHKDYLGSVRNITGADGTRDTRNSYRPFGEVLTVTWDPTQTAETKGFIGERFDADAGLQYLNARYYDPQLGLFIQPDWWEVTTPGVGTNRYSYSFNDPINLSDPGGNFVCGGLCIGAVAALTGYFFADTVFDNTIAVIEAVREADDLVERYKNGEITQKEALKAGGDIAANLGVNFIESAVVKKLTVIPGMKTVLEDLHERMLPKISGGKIAGKGVSASTGTLSSADFPEVRDRISPQKQDRHVVGTKEYKGGGAFANREDAQKVLDAYHSGDATIIGKDVHGNPVVRFNDVTGLNNNPKSGFENQPTNVFIIKGTKSPSVVPANPKWTP